MYKIIVLSVLLAILNVVASEECDNLGVLVYEDLGCKPVKKEGQACPVKYDCDVAPKKNSCLFKAKSYNIGEALDSDLIYETCNVGCSCLGDADKTRFNCAILDCPEWLGSPLEPGCYRKYELNKCCSTGAICPPFDNIAKCEGAGFNVTEGEKFTPENTCLKCLCQKDFKGKFEAPFCKRELCTEQIRHSADIANHCAPGYFTKTGVLCCPSTWICPEASDKISQVNPNADKTSDLTCKFGEKTLKLGEGFERSLNQYGADHNMKCECVIPPLLTCKEQ